MCPTHIGHLTTIVFKYDEPSTVGLHRNYIIKRQGEPQPTDYVCFVNKAKTSVWLETDPPLETLDGCIVSPVGAFLQPGHDIDVHITLLINYRMIATTRDRDTHYRLFINGQYSYPPENVKECWKERLPDSPVTVYICEPLHSLRQACMLALSNHIVQKQDVDQLGLPEQLSATLKDLVKEKKQKEEKAEKKWLSVFRKLFKLN